ncbi:hypothetical protein K435DRAFT_726590 [Dendrothele bispora CBS 962.96]|uniref:Uncharacterized protein n=1 Tax=Dendrothele bispora (strain CBS 962.96) TaxID=1314807 RepID=A0A4S8LSP1_DENBC|nr:hypothetical protein K435DRAFT_726590 [Dendrothele bispora CBS 962.96]
MTADNSFHHFVIPPLSRKRGQSTLTPTLSVRYQASHDTNASDHDGFYQSFGNSTEGGTEQSDQNTYDGNSARSTADDLPSNTANADSHPNGPSRNFCNINGGYTEQDNREIGRNVGNWGDYREVNHYTVNFSLERAQNCMLVIRLS